MSGQQKLEDLYWWKRVCPETPKLVAQVACLLCPVPTLCEVFGGLQVATRPNKRPRIPNIEEAKMSEGIVYGTPIKNPEDHHHQFATLVILL